MTTPPPVPAPVRSGDAPLTPAVTTTQVYQVIIRATPEAVWAALVDPEQTSRYFHRARIEVVGDRIVSHGPAGELWTDGAILESDPPHRLVHEWRSLYDPVGALEPASRVTWQLDDRGDGTVLLTAVHDRLEGSPHTASSVSGVGWATVLSGLKTLLETGEPLVR